MRPTARTKLAGLTTALVLAGAGMAATAGPATAQPAPLAPLSGAFHPIINSGNGKCLQPEGGSAGEATIVQATCNGSITQQWLFLNRSGSTYHIINQFSGLCMYMNGPVAAGSPISQVRCTSVSNEDWSSVAPPAVSVRVMSQAGHRNTNLCIAVPDGQPTEGLPVEILDCTSGDDAQNWVIGLF
ncbi:RICIN domain-containing protein [Streptomyces sp. H10-C2]|uniref:RICIN domain-containing protein n=1 Tax=unclassified Streptomyces TaxID=2593676 RepID=UPI0024B8DEB2|nr:MULTISPECIES: RICIN domain-containing protein [unclassified Streptomyces]MDJ0342590.1 RICIN domain-containing protein [Streptomyces sp. PH10-H1]MDJ0368556.1 RICIN domain-containing protein [Streptomyces sp. H10-C2]